MKELICLNIEGKIRNNETSKCEINQILNSKI
jgi:hypothetical protein